VARVAAEIAGQGVERRIARVQSGQRALVGCEELGCTAQATWRGQPPAGALRSAPGRRQHMHPPRAGIRPDQVPSAEGSAGTASDRRRRPDLRSLSPERSTPDVLNTALAARAVRRCCAERRRAAVAVHGRMHPGSSIRRVSSDDTGFTVTALLYCFPEPLSI